MVGGTVMRPRTSMLIRMQRRQGFIAGNVPLALSSQLHVIASAITITLEVQN